MNVILMADAYKYTQSKQYPKDVTYMMSYFESRGGDSRYYSKNHVKFFGLQYFLKQYLAVKITTGMVEEANTVITGMGLDFDYDGWMYIATKLDGKLPIKIRAVKEGSIIQRKNVLMTIESTDSRVFWVVGFLETLLMKVWYPTTVATLSYNIKKSIKEFMLLTSDNLDKLPFMLHDFGYRGVSSEESALLGSMAHLTNFMGTDTVNSVVGASRYYSTKNAGFSIPASEHSTMTTYGKEGEKEAFEMMLDTFGGDGKVFACVSDSYDYFKALKMWSSLAGKIKAMNTTLVVRPDSGDAKTNVLAALREFEVSFGYTTNSKGYKVLNNVAVIQGDGVNQNEIYDILKMMQDNKYSADNIAFGMGGALLQGNYDSSINRDTHKFAIKCCAVLKGDKLVEIFKDPITDSGKQSKRGRLDLICNDGIYQTVKLEDMGYADNSEFLTYFENGEVLIDLDLYGNIIK